MILNNKLTIEQIDEMFNKQILLNNETNGTKWRMGETEEGRRIDWLFCANMELMEYIDSFNWKHWKDLSLSADIENAKMELVDIWHFLMSECIKRDSDIGLLVDNFLDLMDEDVLFIEIIPIEVAKSMSYELNVLMHDKDNTDLGSLDNVLRDFLRLIYITGDFNLEELYKLFMIKVELNKYRQDNGYKDGQYIKNWVINGKTYEDNEYVTKHLDISNFGSIYDQIDEMYNRKEN